MATAPQILDQPLTLEKPLLRGASHAIAFVVALFATAPLVLGVFGRGSPRIPLAGLVFGGSLALLFGTSALYHRVAWTPRARKRMRRMDHAAIFVLIAGGHTPLLALVEASSGGHTALLAIWIGAGLGVAKSLAWPGAPKWVTALLCVGVGWMAVWPIIDRTPIVGALCVGLLLASGVTYTLGALVYALKRPDPFPRVFGYHEVFHALVVAASACLYGHVVLVMRSLGG